MLCPICQRSETNVSDKCLDCFTGELWSLEKEFVSMLDDDQVSKFRVVQERRIIFRQRALGSAKAPEECEFGERFIASLSPKQKEVFQKIRDGEQAFLCRVFGEPKCFVRAEKMAESL